MKIYQDHAIGKVAVNHSVINLSRWGMQVTVKRYGRGRSHNFQLSESTYTATPASLARVWSLIDSGKFYLLLPNSGIYPASYISR